MAPDAVLGVDTGSTDGSAEQLRVALPLDAVVLDAPGATFGRAVGTALRHLSGGTRALPDAAGAGAAEAAGPHAGEQGTGPTQWLWLLHDDSAPRPEALAELLDAVEKAPSVVIAGCKQVDADSRGRLLDVGLSTTRSGRRFSRVGSDEVDQGQYDGVSDTLGVNTAGMLVRRDVFEELGGFDPALPGVGDDVDLGRRAWLAGHRVIVVPGAVVDHQADTVQAVAGPRVETRAAAYTRMKYASGPGSVLLALWMLVAGVGRALGRLVAKDPSGAVIDLGAGATAFLRPGQLAAGRRNAARTRTVPRGVVRPLLAKPSQVRDRRRTLREERLLAGNPGVQEGTAQQEATGGDDSFAALESGSRPAGSATSGLVAVLVAAALSLLGLYRLFDAPALAGGSLLAPSTVLGDLWSRATSSWQPVGTGAAAPPDPFDLLIWLSGVVSIGHAQIAAVVLYVLAMPLAALTAWLCLGAVTSRLGIRFLGALAFALAPTLQVALAQGRPGALVVHVVAPLFVLALIRAVGAARPAGQAAGPGTGGVPSWAAVAGASLLGAVLVCAEPLMVLPLLVGAIIAAALFRRARGLWWLPIPGVLVALPLLIRAVSDPRVLLVQPGVPQSADTAPVWQQLLGWPVSVDTGAALPGLPVLGSGWAVWVVLFVLAPLGVLALIAVLTPGRGTTTARVLFLTGLLALVGGAAASRLDATVSGERIVAPFVGPYLSFFLVGLLVAAGVGAQRITARRRTAAADAASEPVSGAGARAAWGVAGSVLTVAVLVSAVAWAAPRVVPGQLEKDALGTAQRVDRTAVSPLPATAADRGQGKYAERTLVLSVGDDGRISASLASGAGVRLEDLSGSVAAAKLQGNVFLPTTTSRSAMDAGDEAVRQAVAALASGEATDNRTELADLGVSSVVLRTGGTGADVMARALDAQPALAAVGRSGDDDAWIWRVQTGKDSDDAVAPTGSPTARIRVLSADGATLSLLPSADDAAARINGTDVASGPDGRLLVLAESSDPGWHATLNGKDLKVASHGWTQAFELPAGGGTLRVWHAHGWNIAWLVVLALGLLVALLSIVPVPRAWRGDARAARSYRPSVAERGAPAEENAEADEDERVATESDDAGETAGAVDTAPAQRRPAAPTVSAESVRPAEPAKPSEQDEQQGETRGEQA